MPRTSLHGESEMTLAVVEETFGPFARRPEEARCDAHAPGDATHRCNRLAHGAGVRTRVHAELTLLPDGLTWRLEAWTEHRDDRRATPRPGGAPLP